MSEDTSQPVCEGSRVPLAVIVVNYRTPDLTIACLRSVEPEVAGIPGLRLVVVDNDSGDGSAKRLQEAIDAGGWQGWARLVRSDRNLGFAGGNNLGIREAGDAELVLLLNSDTIVHPGCLRACVDAMRADPGVGALSANVLNEDGSVQNVARRFPTPARQVATLLGLPWRFPRLFSWADMEDPGWDRRNEARDVDWLGGAFLMLRGDVLAEIGGLDEGFFFYGEDIVLCHRVKEGGYRRRYDPCGTLVHLGGASPDPSREAGQQKNAQAWRARYLVQQRCHGRWAEWLLRAADLVVLSARLVAGWLRGGRSSPRYAAAASALGIVTGRLACRRR